MPREPMVTEQDDRLVLAPEKQVVHRRWCGYAERSKRIVSWAPPAILGERACTFCLPGGLPTMEEA